MQFGQPQQQPNAPPAFGGGLGQQPPQQQQQQQPAQSLFPQPDGAAMFALGSNQPSQRQGGRKVLKARRHK